MGTNSDGQTANEMTLDTSKNDVQLMVTEHRTFEEEDGGESEEFDLESWQEPDNVNLDCDVRTFWEKIKEASDMLDPHGGIRLKLDEIIVSPFSLVLSIRCECAKYAITGRPLLLSRMKNVLNDIVGIEYPHVLESLPGSSNIGIGLRRSYDDDAVPSLTEMMDSDVYKDLSGNPNSVPIVLGINHMNKPLVVDLSNHDNMVVIGGDTLDQSYTAEVVVNGLLCGRSPYDLQLTVLDGRDSCPIVRGYADMPYSKNSLSTPPTDKNLVSWCKRAISILDEAERDCAMRRKIIEGDDYEYSNIESYNRGTGRNLARRVVMMANFPHAAFNASDRAKEAVEHLRVRVRDFIELEKSDVGVHFVLWDFGNFWDSNDIDMGLVDSLLTVKGKTHFVAYTRFDELGSLLNFAGGREACGDNDLGPLVYRSPEGDIHYFQFAKVKDEERNLAIDKWGLTRMTVNDNIPDDETSADSSIEEETEVEVIAESAADDDELPPHTGEPGGWSPTA